MAVNFDRWTLLKFVELILVLVCLTFKRVTDDEASRVFLYLQKLSREWSLLNNITWSRVGAALGDATYGGYLIITFALFIGRMFGELPTRKRITEYILLGIGTILFVVLGSLSFAALDSVPHDLVDNAAIVGTVSLVTAGLFLLDIGGPRAKKQATEHKVRNSKNTKNECKIITQQVYDVEKEINNYDKKDLDAFEKVKKKNKDMNGIKSGTKNGLRTENGIEMELPKSFKGYQQMKDDDFPQRYGIYGKDVVDVGNETDETEELQMPPRMEPHSPVWSHIRKGLFGKPEIVSSPLVIPKQQQQEDVRPPSRPSDPGYVQYTAQHWGGMAPKTPRHSPTEV